VTAGLAGDALSVSGTGTVTMGSGLISVASVLLHPGASGMTFIADDRDGLAVDDGGGAADTVQAGGPGQTLTGGACHEDFLGFAGGATVFKDSTAAFDGDRIGNCAAAGSVLDFTDLAAQSLSLAFVENPGQTAGVLTVGDRHHAASLTLAGSFAAAGFMVAPRQRRRRHRDHLSRATMSGSTAGREPGDLGASGLWLIGLLRFRAGQGGIVTEIGLAAGDGDIEPPASRRRRWWRVVSSLHTQT
jgi:hypothetical protein